MLLAWDTTNRLNWGARAAHLATRQILAPTAEDLEVLPGIYQREEEPINFVLSERISRAVWKRRDQYRWADLYTRMESALGTRADYLDPRPEVSRRNILENRDQKVLGHLVEAIERHETIVVDGDGDMIFKRDPKRNLLADLALIELSDHLGKEVYYVNSIFSDCAINGRNQLLADRCLETLQKCEEVAFRDPSSLELARQLGGRLGARMIPDSLFYWWDDLHDSRTHLPDRGDFLIPYGQERAEHFGKLDFAAPYVCVTGGSRAALDQDRAQEGFTEVVRHLRRLDYPIYLVPTGAGDRFLHDVAQATDAPIVPAEVPILMGGAVLANAELFVTGRYHPSIMAASGGTPCVFLGADSHKTSSIQRLLGFEEPQVYSAIPRPDEHDDILSRCRELLDSGSDLRQSLQEKARRLGREAARLAELVV